MKVKLRAKAGGPLQVLDENGKEIEGLVEFRLRSCGAGEVPEVALLIRGPEIQVDAEAQEEMKQGPARLEPSAAAPDAPAA